MEKALEVLKKGLKEEQYNKLVDIKNPGLHRFVAEHVELCNPDEVFVCTDKDEDRMHIRNAAIESGEEKSLAVEGHTIHFDGYFDQGRDKKNTKFLLPKGVDLGSNINSIDRDVGLEELRTDFSVWGRQILNSQFPVSSLPILLTWHTAKTSFTDLATKSLGRLAKQTDFLSLFTRRASSRIP